MSDEYDVSKDPEAKTWSAKFPGELANKMKELVKEYGYMGMSDFIREACREKVMYLQVRAHKLLLDYLVTAGKLSVGDVKEAIYAITSGQV